MLIRSSSRRCHAAAACRTGLVVAAILGGLASLTAQGLQATAAVPVAPASPPTVSTPFAWPWEVTFDRIERAMAERSYRIVQMRRILDQSDPRVQSHWLGMQELLLHGARSSAGPETFDLQFLGLEGQALSPQQFAARKKAFDEQAGFLYHYQSFRVSDATLADQNYALLFLGVGTRLQRPVYRMAAYSKVGMRTGWLLELDALTGYPLYRGEYDLQGRLVSEVEVTAFDDGFRGVVPQRLDPFNSQLESSPQAALTAAGVTGASVPSAAIVPPAYAVHASKVLTDPYTGVKRAIVIYSDGVDEMFVEVAPDSRTALTTGPTIAFFRDPAGITQCTFVDSGSQYVVVGRDTRVVKGFASNLYTEAVQ